MSSGPVAATTLEQLMVESGRLQPRQTLNYRAWGPPSVLSASRKNVLPARIGELDDLSNYRTIRNLGVNLSWPRRQTWLPKVYQNRPKTKTWA